MCSNDWNLRSFLGSCLLPPGTWQRHSGQYSDYPALVFIFDNKMRVIIQISRVSQIFGLIRLMPCRKHSKTWRWNVLKQHIHNGKKFRRWRVTSAHLWTFIWHSPFFLSERPPVIRWGLVFCFGSKCQHQLVFSCDERSDCSSNMAEQIYFPFFAHWWDFLVPLCHLLFSCWDIWSESSRCLYVDFLCCQSKSQWTIISHNFSHFFQFRSVKFHIPHKILCSSHCFLCINLM